MQYTHLFQKSMSKNGSELNVIILTLNTQIYAVLVMVMKKNYFLKQTVRFYSSTKSIEYD